jgi:dTDP-4-dehydrorhamnose reductase
MKLLITGLSGTLAPHLAARAKERGWQVQGWSRHEVPADDSAAARGALQGWAPDAIAHLSIGSAEWAGLLAGYAAERGLPFMFTSTAMVFDHRPDGPHRVDDPRNAQDGYGQSKIACEDRIRSACPHAAIARLGWQIDVQGSGNNMLAELDRWQAREGRVLASAHWVPACSFMSQTSLALTELIAQRLSGTFHLDANAQEAWRFDQIVQALCKQFDRRWQVEPDTSEGAYRHDQRLVGGGWALPALSQALPALAG